MSINLVELKQTCSSCPAQWEGRSDDGLYLYFRYRFSRLTFGYGNTMDEAVENSMNGVIRDFPERGEFHSDMHEDELLRIMKGPGIRDMRIVKSE